MKTLPSVITSVVCLLILAAMGVQAAPIHDAVKSSNIREVERILMVDSTALVARDGFGNTPLHTAALLGNTAIVEFLLYKSADQNLKNNKGLLPVELARQHCQTLLDMFATVSTADSTVPAAAEIKSSPPPVPAKTVAPAQPAKSGDCPPGTQCQATTKKGTQCSRKAAAGSCYCWQHGGK